VFVGVGYGAVPYDFRLYVRVVHVNVLHVVPDGRCIKGIEPGDDDHVVFLWFALAAAKLITI
jgi:hypothetical protein